MVAELPEKRKFSRNRYQRHVQVLIGGERIQCTTTDLSEGGLGAWCDHPLPMGECTVEGPSLHVDARIVHASQGDRIGASHRFYYGIEFQSRLEKADADRLIDIFARMQRGQEEAQRFLDRDSRPN